jgi:tetratricopeptide (TPR) repeat protein
VELDPLDEAGQRRLIELLAAADDRAGAIRQYRSLVALFDRELGVAPLRETTDAYEAIREETAAATAATAATVGPVVVRASQAGVPAPPVMALPFVGRDQQLAAILAAAATATPDGRLILVEGEAGIGKTRLAEVAADDMRTRGGVVLATRGYPGEAAIAYGPIADLLRSGLATPEGAERLTALDPAALGEIGRLVELPAALRGSARIAPDVGDHARVRLLEAIADALTALVAGPIPGLLSIDDLHHADGATRQAVAYLARRLDGRPLVLLMTWRREDLTPDGLATAGDLVGVPGVLVLILERLDRASIARLVRAAADASGTAPAASEALIDSVVADSEGLPLQIVETLASGDPASGTVPREFRALLRERIASVGETAAQVLSAAAVIGRSFDLTTVRRSSGRSEEETVDAIEELMRRGIVREIEGKPGGSSGGIRYDFSHGRLRDEAYEMSSLARRRLLHRRTADSLRLDLDTGGRDDMSTIARIAGHERAAGRTTEAAAAYLDAADRAEAVFANRETIEHLEAALALGRPEPVAIHVRIGELHARLGEYPAAIQALETAAALAGADGLARIEVQLGRVHRRRGDLAAAASHLDAALAAVDLRPALQARALVERSRVALQAGDLALASTTAREARATAEAHDDPHAAGVAERLVGLVAQASGDLASARLAFERSQTLAAGDPDPTAAIAATTALAIALADAGELDPALEAGTHAIEECRRIGDRHLEAAVENHMADLLHEGGREPDAMQHLKRAVALFAEIGDAGPERDPGIWALAAW